MDSLKGLHPVDREYLDDGLRIEFVNVRDEYFWSTFDLLGLKATVAIMNQYLIDHEDGDVPVKSRRRGNV